MPGEQDHSDDGHWVHVSEGIFPELEAMGLSVTVPKPAPEKRGSPRKNPLPDPNATKKKRGRPPKKKIKDQAIVLRFEVYLQNT